MGGGADQIMTTVVYGVDCEDGEGGRIGHWENTRAEMQAYIKKMGWDDPMYRKPVIQRVVIRDLAQWLTAYRMCP